MRSSREEYVSLALLISKNIAGVSALGLFNASCALFCNTGMYDLVSNANTVNNKVSKFEVQSRIFLTRLYYQGNKLESESSTVRTMLTKFGCEGTHRM